VVSIGRGEAVDGLQRGDIHFAAFPDLGGHVLKGPHPAVVVQTRRIHGSSTTIVLPMTSSARAAEFEPPFLVKVAGRECGLPRDGWIKCDQPATLPTVVLGPRVGRLNPEAIDRLDKALRFVLGL
jgi:mRNA-degrading endonuclease toxin of MazEF toxin-antitoxin module